MIKYLLFAILFLPILAFAQQERGSMPFQVPETLDEAKGFGETILMAIPTAIGTIWKEEVVPVWTKMLDWAKNLLNRIVAREQEKILQELQTEKEKVSQSLKERFLDLFNTD